MAGRFMMHVPITKILIEQGAENYGLTSNILKSLDKISVKRIHPDSKSHKRREFSNMDKKTLLLTAFKGDFIKPCPGTKGYICCGYLILNVGTNCPLDCTYCILQTYFNQPSLKVFVNLEDEIGQLGRIIDSNPEKIFRIGTGEFTDSLALDHITGWSNILSGFFEGRKNSILELKTKTDRIDGLLSIKQRDRIIVSWSLNSPYIAAREENGAPSIEKRLLAAKRCQSEGYAIGFHFDPLIWYSDWKEGYMRTIEMLDRYIDPNRIIWISLGCLRYIPALKSIIRRRHPQTHILDGEFIRGIDGKMRYFKPLRIEMYSFINEQIKKWAKNTGTYLCMESDEVWNRGLGWSPADSEGLSSFLDRRVKVIFKN